MDFLRKSSVSELLDELRQFTCWPTGSLDTPPFGERECMDSLGKATILRGPMVPGNRESWPTGSLDPPPLGERECMDFLRKSYGSELLDELR